MGYSNEKASPNKYSKMMEYCNKVVVEKLSAAISSGKNTSEDLSKLKPKYLFRPDLDAKKEIPVAAIDGGIAVLFPNEVGETKLISMAVGIPPQWQSIFNEESMDSFTHVFTGQLRWPEGVNKSLEDLSEELINTLYENSVINKAMNILGISSEDFYTAIRSRINHLKSLKQDRLVGFEDNIRELLEVSGMVVFTEAQLNNKNLDNFKDKECPYLLIKDGTLFPQTITVSSVIAEAVKNWFQRGDIPVIGVVKNSRFVNDDSVWAKVVRNFGKKVKSHTFFRIPSKVEFAIDKQSDKNSYKRYFLSIFGGENIYEIQVPKIITEDKDKLEFLLTRLAGEITYSYGGSISTNSYAHEKASLPESEAKALTEKLRFQFKEVENEE